MNKHDCIARIGLGLLLLLPANLACAQDANGDKVAAAAPATVILADPTLPGQDFTALNWYFPGMSGGQGGFGGGGFSGFGGNTIASALRRDARWATLTKTVDVQLDRATLMQALSALHEASAINVSAAKSVGDTGKRLNIDARNVPVATVLEAIAKQLDLMIAPDGAAALMLKPLPSIDINGQKSQYRGPNAPWSDEWVELHPGGGFAQSGGGLGGGGGGLGGIAGGGGGLDGSGFGGGQALATAGGGVQASRNGSALNGLSGTSGRSGATATVPGIFGQGSGNSGYSRQYIPSISNRAGQEGGTAPLSMTVSGDRLVVAEPATGPKGESGYRLTVYNIAGSQMKIISSVFHVSASQGKRSYGSASRLFTPSTSFTFPGSTTSSYLNSTQSRYLGSTQLRYLGSTTSRYTGSTSVGSSERKSAGKADSGKTDK